MPIEFKPFPKMARLSREMIITEKLDGTNASILIVPSREVPTDGLSSHIACARVSVESTMVLFAGSRNRWVQPGSNDNYGFAAWVVDNADELVKLGPGQHFGEWWGAGIQRRYGLTEKRFSLFNASRWHADSINGGVFELLVDKETQASTSRPGPRCCSVVPTLYFGDFSTGMIEAKLAHLAAFGSVAAPGFRDPEGIVIYHTAAKFCFKKTILDDAGGKGDASPKSLI